MRRPGSPSRALRLLGAATLLFSLLVAQPRGAAAQSDDGLVDGTSYVSPQFGYSVEWDDPWQADEAGTRSRPDRDDILALADEAADATLLVAGVVTDQSATERLEMIIENRTEAAPDLVSALGPDNDDASAVALLAYPDEDGTDIHEYLEINEGEAGVWLRVVALRVPVESLGAAFEGAGVIEINGDPAFGTAPTSLLDDDAGDDAGNGDRPRPRIPTVEPGEGEEPADEPAEAPDGNSGDLEGVDGTTFTSPNFDLSVTWDEDDWEVASTLIEPGFDQVDLSNSNSGLTVVATDQFGSDPADCLEQLTSILAEDQGDLIIDDVDTFEDEDGKTIEGETGDGAFVAIEYTGSFDGDEVTFIRYVECNLLVEDESVWFLVHLIFDPDTYTDEAVARESVDIVVPEGDDEAGDDSDEDTQTPEDDETPVADDEETPSAESETGFTSETFGFSLAWDGDDWVEDDRDADTVSLSHASSLLTVAGVEDYDGDAVACVQGEIDALRGQQGVTRVEPEVGEDGRRVSGGDAEGFFGLYRITASDGTFDGTNGVLFYVECRTLVENDAVLIISHLVFDPDAYADEAALAGAVIETIVLSE